jgi:hypothetical protein
MSVAARPLPPTGMVFEVFHRALLREAEQRVQGVRGQVVDDELELRPTNLAQLVTRDRQRLDRPADLDQVVSPPEAIFDFAASCRNMSRARS